ncbi:dephospho-CoA kinase [Alloacidobacterium dinghuense]|uniref:Dephospho-CoA kinase n=1 Tax=Alloacidobacterium dinghuense TaxID=2763107 RepID=A0A7G8BF75_9BACT|nr:dephospho-CoA kinase [Alloacidobacterium dinghuense]QNI31195.1 dephospho-CoA kinase [Alloacidobacterium dinghuense]
MLRVGLTGGLGSGKSTVAEMFAARGVHVISADEVGRRLMQPGEGVYRQIVEQFGKEVVRADGTLNRPLLAELAFRQGRLDELNRIVHPAVIAAQEEWANDLEAREPDAIAMIESALIFEAGVSGSVPGWKDRFDKIVLVTAPDDVKIQRFLERIGTGMQVNAEQLKLFEEDARSRLAAQIPDSEKIPFSDYVIDNSGSLERTRQEVDEVFGRLRSA